jgi:hypothetical protein
LAIPPEAGFDQSPTVQRVAVLNVVGLTRSQIGPSMPRLARFLTRNRLAVIDPALPAVTCTAQSTYVTGLSPRDHGIVANGWYNRELAEVQFWKQSNHLVGAPKVWDTLKAMDPAFTCAKTSVDAALGALESIKDDLGFEALSADPDIAKISLIGAGMRSHPGVSATFFQALAENGVNIEMISTSEIRISVVTRAADAAKATQALHTAFGLDADSEAVVYAGTGR